MSVGIIGQKVGMTQIFDQQEGLAIPVTVIQAGPCTVTQIKSKETDGYSAVQLGYQQVKSKALTKPEQGHLAKAGSPPLRHLKEYRVADSNSFELGQAITAENFSAGQVVDINGNSIGRGFAGYQKRYNFNRGFKTHGSKGGKPVTIRKLKVVRVDTDRNLLLIKGSIPGKSGSLLSIAPSKQVGQS
ncbi:MAG: 50S ribosomal protein L3 [Cyanobacteria bacterium SW_11_48_12]|nr:MAG: 50S ribosomal protein L3 [Cyanobacteria bacterium SW_11_48_12]